MVLSLLSVAFGWWIDQAGHLIHRHVKLEGCQKEAMSHVCSVAAH